MVAHSVAPPVSRHLPLPCVAVAGEAKSGKSSLINALLGAPALPTGLTDHVLLPVLVSYASKPSLVLERSDRRRVATDWIGMTRVAFDNIRRLRLGLPNDLLKTYRFIETPEFAAGYDDLGQLGLEACRRANAAIWCTPAVQAWKASERDTWLSLPKRLHGRSILAVTYKDAIFSERDMARLNARLRVEAGPYFGDIVMIASPDAMRARQQRCGAEDVLWHSSGGAEFHAGVRTLIGKLGRA